MVIDMAALIDGAKVPEFETDEQEAQWWDEHKSQVEQNLGAAMRNDTARRGSAQRVVKDARTSKNITIRMPLADLERARRLSSKKGLAYQTYMKMLLHEVLDREEKHGAA
jgi:predicted DNA binding CopG/RHH family protein